MPDATHTPPREHILFVTGSLAENAVRAIVATVAGTVGFDYTIQVLPITVAALMTGKWVLRKLDVPAGVTRVILPGYLSADLEMLSATLPMRVECGPRDIRDLPDFFGEKREKSAGYGAYRTAIIAEINHAPALARDELLRRARQLASEGADIIDLGCTPGSVWTGVGDAVRAVRDAGLRVSIDSFDVQEVRDACRAGAELVLSVNSTNRDAAPDWGVEVVAIPDVPGEEKNFSQTIEFLAAKGVPQRLDPILEPIGFGFTESLLRYAQTRKRYPQLPMMMGIGNITELTDVDSAGINALLLGVCEELSIESVLTTNVINWARSSVRECDVARRLMHYACQQRVPPKRLDDRLVQLRDPRVREFPREVIDQLAAAVRDRNVRLLVHAGEIHFITAGAHFHGTDPFQIMQQVLDSPLGPAFDASHAFYLGFEMSKALTAITLDKQYEQDEPLRWGLLTRELRAHRLPRRKAAGGPPEPPG
jgi:dihydropteroate synthase